MVGNLRSSHSPGAPPELALTLTREPALLPGVPSRSLGYLAALVGPALALAATLALQPFVQSVMFVLFWPVVILVAVWAGRGPGVVASLTSVLLVDFFILIPVRSLGLADLANLVPLSAFLAGSLLVSAVTDRMRVARRDAAEIARANASAAGQLRKQAQLLEEQAAELELHMEEAQTLSEELELSNQALIERTGEAEANEQRTRSILESIGDPFIVYDAGWRIRYLNGAAREAIQLRGYAAEELRDAVLWEVFPQFLGTDVERVLRRAATERRVSEAEIHTPEAGSWMRISAYPLPDGGVAAQWRNITARKRTEEAAGFLARASDVLGASLDYEKTLSELAELLVPGLGDWAAVELVDREGPPKQVAVSHVDPRKVKLVRELRRRYPPEDDAPLGPFHVLRSGEPELHPDIPEELLELSARDAEHLRLLHALGLRSAMFVPMRVGDDVIGVLSIASAESRRSYGQADLDLALELARRGATAVEKARLHREAVEARARAEEANRAKTEFLTVMSHELRTPLNAISGYVELMSLGIRGPITPEQREDLARIDRSQRHLLALINDLLNYARVEGGHVDYRIEALSAREILEEMEPLISPQVQGKQLEFSVTLPSDDLRVRADREKTRQILLNLLSNALKFTPSGGRIELGARRLGAGSVEIQVSDSGVGIPEEKLEAVFEPFVQLGRTLASPAEGTGLGLAISRDLARGMGGDLRATSCVGEGSTFTLVLPSA